MKGRIRGRLYLGAEAVVAFIIIWGGAMMIAIAG